MNLVDMIAPGARWVLGAVGRPLTYARLDGSEAQLTAFVRGLRSEDLFAGAAQQDVAGVVDAAQFGAAFPARPLPQRLDRVRIGPRSWTVEEWRGAPNDDAPVFYKLLLRGGSQ
jgi:hypothetical protein